ncbi:NupC/NupG family nucleoside CNT transporter [Candidatus Proelusimicrobium volucris]|uniref:NupC/NupG family nucleoside CNT transporter n=1 Tax=Candidatus Proelusimicrobium volucris TaxID=3416225 RepID=UPI003D12CD0C
MANIAALIGVVVFIGIGYALSTNRKAINWRTILWAFGLQIVFAVLILKTSVGVTVFNYLNDAILKVLDFQKAGAEMVFGPLATQETLGYIFAFQVIPTIIFFSALMSLLYYLGIMQKVVYVFALVLGKLCKLSGAESLSAAANIFVGQTEAPLLIKPYVEKMTKSELMCVMTGGMATVAGGVLAAYIIMLKDNVPGIAGHLMAASVMGAPAGVMFSKLMVPETEKPITLGVAKIDYKDPSANVLDAISNGTTTGLQLALNVAAMLIAFTALIALCSGFVEWVTGWFMAKALTIEQIFGYVFSPLAWLMGVPADEMVLAGQLVGEKTILNEFVAYANFSSILNGDTVEMSLRTKVILSYALCGFANFSSIGIQIGGIGAIAPNRRADLSRLGFRALIAGLLASCLRGIIAGLLVH